jgi:hypothetical protein
LSNRSVPVCRFGKNMCQSRWGQSRLLGRELEYRFQHYDQDDGYEAQHGSLAETFLAASGSIGGVRH